MKIYWLAFSLILLLAVPAGGTYVPYAPQNFNDELFWLYDNGDATKKLVFELDAITTGNTRTIVIGDADGNTADWNAASDWGDHGLGGYLKADGTVTLTGAQTCNVGTDTNYIELDPGADNYARIDSNGDMWLTTNGIIELTTGAGADMFFDCGGNFEWQDTDAAYANRMILDSATGDLWIGGAIDVGSGTIDGVTIGTNSACTELQVDNININGAAITSSTNAISFGDDYIYTTGDFSCDELILTEGQDFRISRRSTDYMTFEGQNAGSGVGYELAPEDGDGSDFIAITLWHRFDTINDFPDINPSEYFQILFDNSPEEVVMFTSYVTSTTAHPIHFRVGGNTSQLRLETDGGVKSLTSYNNTVGGTNHALYIDSTGLIGKVPSGIEYKKNIEDINNSDRLYSLRPVCYDANDSSGAINLYGLIAEEVDLVMPEIVQYKTEPIMGEQPSTVDPNIMEPYIKGYRQTDIPEGVNMDRLIPLMLKEIQLLKARVDALEAEVEKPK